jgi:hypothetical protein
VHSTLVLHFANMCWTGEERNYGCICGFDAALVIFITSCFGIVNGHDSNTGMCCWIRYFFYFYLIFVLGYTAFTFWPGRFKGNKKRVDKL